MKISFKLDGGFGFFPGLNKKLEIDTSKLPKQEAENVTRMVTAIDFKNLLVEKKETKIGADLKKYTIEIEDDDTRSEFSISDDEQNLPIQDLLHYLKNKQKEMR